MSHPHAAMPPHVAAGLSSAAAGERAAHDRRMMRIDFNQSPFTVVWEVTLACGLHCTHCRAKAIKRRDPRELTTNEGKALLRDIKSFGNPILVLTGGDPMERDDLEELVDYAAHDLGLRTSLTPSATPKVTRERLVSLHQAGILRFAMSLDGPRAEIHDKFRGWRGCYDLTLRVLDDLRALDIPFQINTTVSRETVDALPEMAEHVAASGAVQWSLFFLVPTGRARLEQMISADEHEDLMHWLAELKDTAPFDIKATAAPFYRRVAIERERAKAAAEGGGGPITFAGAGFRYEDGLDRPMQGVNDGKGFVFVSHTGDVTPNGLLPYAVANIRDVPLPEIYRHDPLFVDLRDPDKLLGKCGQCGYRVVCGGSRARAFAVTGNLFESDPVCAYEPSAS